MEIPKRPQLSSQGPLAQALTELWEKARQAKVTAVEKLVIRFFEAAATWKVHQAMATLKDAEVNCRFEADIKQEGVNTFQLEFDGRMDKANAVKSFLDPQLRIGHRPRLHGHLHVGLLESSFDRPGQDPRRLPRT